MPIARLSQKRFISHSGSVSLDCSGCYLHSVVKKEGDAEVVGYYFTCESSITRVLTGLCSHPWLGELLKPYSSALGSRYSLTCKEFDGRGECWVVTPSTKSWSGTIFEKVRRGSRKGVARGLSCPRLLIAKHIVMSRSSHRSFNSSYSVFSRPSLRQG